MIVTFLGHADFLRTEEYEGQILSFLEETVGDLPAEMYLGGYGGFDRFAFECCKKYKAAHPYISLVSILPYLPVVDRYNCRDQGYDLSVYPEIENRPKKYAIVYRNRYMVEKADFVIAYVTHAWGGAYAAYKYAKRRGKRVFNLADWEEA